MMMRRSWVLLSGSGSIAVASSVKSASVSDSSSKGSKVEVAEPIAADYKPPAKEAPELLQAYVEPTPFVSPRRLQLFSVSLAVGAMAIGVLYFLLSKAIGASAEDEQREVDRVTERNRLAALERQKLFPEFNAPSSFEQLYEKIQRHDREMVRQETQISVSTSMLHTEVVYHVKMWWNRCLTHLQDAIERGSHSQRRREEANLRRTISASLHYAGYDVVQLNKVERVA